MAEISEQVKVLDGVARYRFGGNAERMGAWARVHSVVGPFRTHTEPQVGGVRRRRRRRPHPLSPSPFRRGGTKGWFNNEARWVDGHLPRLVDVSLLSRLHLQIDDVGRC